MKRTLLITTDFYPNLGGIANYWYNLTQNLPKGKVVVLAQKINDYEDNLDLKIYRRDFFSFWLWPKWLFLIWYIYKIIKIEKIEKIIVAQILPIGTAVWLLNKFYKISYLASCHGMDIKIPQKNPRKLKLIKKIISKADGFIANSNYTKNELIKLGAYQNKITVIYPAANISGDNYKSLNISQPFQHISASGNKIILTVARLVERKGIDMVIKSLPKVLKNISDLEYWIVGAGHDQNRLKKLAQENDLKEKVKFFGAVSEKKLKEFFASCDLFVLPAREIDGDVEGFGIVFLEAGIFGKPVIGGRSGGMSESILDEKTGFLVDPLNINEISDKITLILQDKNLAQRMGKANQSHAKNFTWKKSTEKLIEILK